MVVDIIVSKRKSLEKNSNIQSGFTLWELLFVLLLMGILLTTITPHLGSAANLVRTRVNRANVQKIEGAAQRYRIDIGTYPPSVAELLHSPEGVNGWHGPYLEEIPINPFNSEQGYQLDALGKVK